MGLGGQRCPDALWTPPSHPACWPSLGAGVPLSLQCPRPPQPVLVDKKPCVWDPGSVTSQPRGRGWGRDPPAQPVARWLSLSGIMITSRFPLRFWGPYYVPIFLTLTLKTGVLGCHPGLLSPPNEKLLARSSRCPGNARSIFLLKGTPQPEGCTLLAGSCWAW